MIKLFRNKKGATHVDWIMSLGIFLVSIGLLFTFLKPGTLPETPRIDILDNLIQEFSEEFGWEVRVMPLFIDECKGAGFIPPGGGGGTGAVVYAPDYLPPQTQQKTKILQGSGMSVITGKAFGGCKVGSSCTTDSNCYSSYWDKIKKDSNLVIDTSTGFAIKDITGKAGSSPSKGCICDNGICKNGECKYDSHCDTGKYCWNHRCITCEETDGGNDPGTAGITSIMWKGQALVQQADSCSSDTTLNEYYCLDGGVIVTTHDCTYECADGACLNFGECGDGQDNDGDGYIDLNDPGCAENADENPFNDGGFECNDGIDNDEDGAEDEEDFSCLDSFGVYNPTHNDESNPLAQCQDELDNDEDGYTDMGDPGCTTQQDNSEDDGTIQESDTHITLNVQNEWQFTRIRYKDNSEEWNLPLESIDQLCFYCRDTGSNDKNNLIFNIQQADQAEFLLSYIKEDQEITSQPEIAYSLDASTDYDPQANVRFGTEEKLEGANIAYLKQFTITNDDYNPETLKEEWEFPEGSEFWIQGWKEKDEIYWCGTSYSDKCDYIVNYKTANPPLNANIIQKEVKMVLLSPTGRREPTRFFFRTWT